MKNKKVESTMWLDFLGFVFIPFIILIASLLAIRLFGKKGMENTIYGILLIFYCLYSFVTFYHLLKRKRITFYIVLGFIILTTVIIPFDIIVRYEIDQILYKELIVLGTIIIWLIPNIIYIIKKRNTFKDYHLLNIKKCPGCNRYIPVTMKSCGKCKYKG